MYEVTLDLCRTLNLEIEDSKILSKAHSEVVCTAIVSHPHSSLVLQVETWDGLMSLDSEQYCEWFKTSFS